MRKESSVFVSLLIVGASAAGSWSALAQGTTQFQSVLDSAQVNPPFGVEGDPIGSPFNGTASLQLEVSGVDGPRLSYSISLPGMDLDGSITPGNFSDDVTAIHIHNGAFGNNGPHVLNVYGFSAGQVREDDADMVANPSMAIVTGIWDDADQLFTGPGGTRQAFDSIAMSAMMDEFNSGDLYFQVHTLNFPNGELRGQITMVPEPGVIPLLTLSAVACFVAFCRGKSFLME